MEELKELFGDGSLSYEQLMEKINANSDKIQLANLKSGNYISKEKFDRVEKDYKDTQKKYNDLVKDTSNKDKTYEEMQSKYDDLSKQFTEMKETNEKNECLGKISAKGGKSEFNDFVFYQVKQNVNDTTNFDKALETYAKANPQYFGTTEPQKIIKVSSSPKADGTGGEDKSINQQMNDAFRTALGKN